MLKKLILAVAASVALWATLALAKDAPFPILAARGTWQAQNDHGLTVSLDVGQAVDNGQAVPVRVTLRNAQGQVIAQGQAIHRLDDPHLTVVVHDAQGRPVRLMLTADGLNDSRNTGGKLSLALFMQTSSGNSGRYILGR